MTQLSCERHCVRSGGSFIITSANHDFKFFSFLASCSKKKDDDDDINCTKQLRGTTGDQDGAEIVGAPVGEAVGSEVSGDLVGVTVGSPGEGALLGVPVGIEKLGDEVGYSVHFVR